ncbi:hypothetical protein LPJ53_003771 [Coemansia erecta]|uniref:Thioesterase/thiol ester dehydrase-isomerase n=1 Tax=Coemansia erecta TaxID=147472 RepID=A0A9W8CPV2_9FUNG|nr:hypothetical protein LPJ53_003771 [Coemansia erecta]
MYTLDDLLDLTQKDDNVFSSRHLWGSPAAPNVFGGQLVGLGLAAAFRTVDDGYIARSLHAQFLKQVLGGGPPVELQVASLSSTCKVVTRTVLCFQAGIPVMQMVCNFMRNRVAGADEPGYQKSMPDVPIPGTSADCQFILDPQGYPGGFPVKIWARELESDCETPAPPRQQIWLENPEPRQRTAQAEQCILATYTDVHFTRVIVRPYGIRIAPAPASECLRGIVSIDHHIWFHRTGDSGCVLVDTQCSQFHGGRGIVSSEVYGTDGTLVATAVQEGRVVLDKRHRLPEPKL